MIAELDSLSRLWVEHFSWLLWQNTLFLAALLILLHLFRRTPARTRYLITRLGLIKLMIPIGLPVQSDWPLSSLVLQGDLSPITMISTNDTAASFASSAMIGFSLWIMVTAIVFLLPLWRTAALYAQLKTGKVISWFCKIPVIQTQDPIPFSFGLFTPVIGVPSDWQKWPAHEQQFILQHEWLHLRRKDGWMRLGLAWIQAIYFFHPLVWLFRLQFLDIMEQSCDEETLVSLPITPIQYSHLLVGVAERQVSGITRGSMVLSFLSTTSALRRRVIHLLHSPLPPLALAGSRFILWSGLIVAITCFSAPRPQLASRSTADSASAFTEPIAYDQAPHPIGGFAELQRALVYPESARKAGHEGKVVLQVAFNAEGIPLQIDILDSSGNIECDRAARTAVRSIQWEPARSQGKPVSVRVAVPIVFRLA